MYSGTGHEHAQLRWPSSYLVARSRGLPGAQKCTSKGIIMFIIISRSSSSSSSMFVIMFIIIIIIDTSTISRLV